MRHVGHLPREIWNCHYDINVFRDVRLWRLWLVPDVYKDRNVFETSTTTYPAPQPDTPQGFNLQAQMKFALYFNVAVYRHTTFEAYFLDVCIISKRKSFMLVKNCVYSYGMMHKPSLEFR